MCLTTEDISNSIRGKISQHTVTSRARTHARTHCLLLLLFAAAYVCHPPSRQHQAVVYAWNQHALRAFIKRRPLIGSCLQKAISEDFVNKVNQSRGHKKRYRLLLEEALDGGEINVTEKKKLHRYCMIWWSLKPNEKYGGVYVHIIYAVHVPRRLSEQQPRLTSGCSK